MAKSWCGASAHTGRLLKRDRYTLMGAAASAFATPTYMGDHESFEAGEALVEEELKGMWLR